MALPAGRRAVPTAALLAARIVYAFNWYDVGAVLPSIGSGLGAGPAALGIVLGSFLLGVGIFQVPAGFASLRFGPRRVSLAGLALLGVASLVSGAAPTWPILAATRFAAGVGAAFFFSPALSLIASYFPSGRRGPVIGLFNGGFSLGGAAGLFLGALVGASLGWGGALAIGGVAMLGSAAVCWATLPRTDRPATPPPPAEIRDAGRAVLRSRSIWALSLALTGFWGAIYIVAQYFVAFADAAHPAWTGDVAAGLAALVVVLSFPGGPLGGWLGERTAHRRRLLGILGVVAGGLVLLVPFLDVYALVGLFVVLGLVDGMVFALLYLIPTYLPETRGEGLALGVAVVNSIQVVLGSLLAIGFGIVVEFRGYTDAWLWAGLVSLALVPLLAFVRSGQGNGGDSPGPDAPSPRPSRGSSAALPPGIRR